MLKTLSLSEKRAVYYGPLESRSPLGPSRTTVKVIVGVGVLTGTAGLIYGAMRSVAPLPPKMITKKWEKAPKEHAKELKIKPLTGSSSERYSGKGFATVAHKWINWYTGLSVAVLGASRIVAFIHYHRLGCP